MSGKRDKATDRFLAILLSIVMLIAALPIGTLHVDAAGTSYALYVNSIEDGSAVDVDGATVDYKVTIDPNAEEAEVTGSATTASGKIDVDLSAYADVISQENPASMDITVSKDGYETVNATITVYDAAGTSTVTMNAVEVGVEQVTVSVTVSSGDAVVEIDGKEQSAVTVDKGSEVPVKITSADGSYIKELTVGGELIDVAKGEAYIGTVKADSDQVIAVNIVKEYTVTVSSGDGGTIALGEQKVASLTVDENTKVSVTVSAGDGYQISSVTVNGVNQSVPAAATSYDTTVMVTKETGDIEIVAAFVKVFSVQVIHKGNGTVTLSPEGEGGKITVATGETVTIRATPVAGYRVSKVEINDLDSITFDENDKSYDDEYEANKDYTVTITFAPNRYEISKTGTQNGSIVINNSSENSIIVDHGSNCDVVVTPEPGFSVETITVSGNDISEFSSDEKDSAVTFVTFEISNIEEPQEISATFIETETNSTEITSLFNSTDAIRVDGMTYIYKNKSTVTFKTDLDGIRLYDENGQIIGESSDPQSVTINETTFISKIQLLYQAKNADNTYKEFCPVWHNVEGVDADNLLKIVIDAGAPEIMINANTEKEFYNGDVEIFVSAGDVFASDESVSSEDKTKYYAGIQSITYWVTCDGEITQGEGYVNDNETESGVIYKYDDSKEAERAVGVKFTVDTSDGKNNSDNVVVHVCVEDRAGNKAEIEKTLKICTIPPTISVSSADEPHLEAKPGYYNKARTIEIIYVEDRATVFDKDQAIGGIKIEKDGEIVEDPSNMIEWSEIDGGKTHIAKISFIADANYKLDVSYSNKAELSNNEVLKYEFTVDTNLPSGTIKLDKSAWNDIVSTLTFGLWKNYSVTAEVIDAADTSRIASIYYYKSNDTKILTVEELEELFKEGKFTKDKYEVSKDEVFVIYARITDNAGNTKYISTDATIVDLIASKITLTPSEANGFYDAESNKNGQYGIYNMNSDVVVDINVEEESEGAFSGIKLVEYWVENNGIETQRATLYEFKYTRDSRGDLNDPEGMNTNGGELVITDWDSKTQKNTTPVVSKGTHPIQSELKQSWNGTVVINKELNNSCNVVVYVRTVDNAGNDNIDFVKLDIDITAPTIEVIFDNGNDNNGNTYFDAQRKATIIITERAHHFDGEAAKKEIHDNISAVDAKGNAVKDAYTLRDWSESKDTENPDEKTYTATLVFEKDANYTWSISYTDKAGNKNEDVMTSVEEGDSIAAFDFTIDTVSPNGDITVHEHTWNKLFSVLTFGLYSNTEVKVAATSNDATSPVVVEYCKTSNTIKDLDKAVFTKCTCEFCEDEVQSSSHNLLSVEPDEQFVVYLKITDYAGNDVYINSDGYIVDEKPSKITLTPSVESGFCGKEHNGEDQHALYNKDSNVTVDIIVEDGEPYTGDENSQPYSGIQLVEYWVENNGAETQSAVLYKFDYTRDAGDNSNGGKLVITDWDSETQKNKTPVVYEGTHPIQSELKQIWNGTVVINKELNNSCDVVVYVRTVDNAGNEKIESVELDIDITAPTIEVIFDNGNDNNGNTYFDAPREATIIITERAHHFDKEDATKGIVVSANDAEGTTVEDAYTLSDWIPSEDTANPDEKTYTANLSFKKDANYEWSISYTDKAGNKNEDVTTSVKEGNSIAAFKFTVDTTKPTGIVKAVSSEGRQAEWYDLKDELTFGFWSREKITISGTAEDATSEPIAAVEYYKVVSTKADDGTTALTEEELDKITEWKPFDSLEIGSDEQFTVYIKITDLAGNYRYISTDGLIVDHTAPSVENVAPEVFVTPVQQSSEIYNSNVTVAIQVSDPMNGGTYSGLKTITYRVLNMGTVTQSGTLYEFNNSNPKQSDLLKYWSGAITVDSSINNSNDVEIIVYAEDNALNGSERKVTIKIDVTDPIINVTYDNNEADNEKYFKADRTATIVVTERNFDPNDVQVSITNTDGIIPTIGSWSKAEGSGNKDNTTWTTTVTYNADGDYTFGIAYTDEANNACSSISYGNSTTPTEFTIDKTLPVVFVSYNNNMAQNGKYFAETRTATIEIVEHNFDVNRVAFTQTASLNGRTIAIPSVSWINNGDVHTATIIYSEDGDYTFDVSVMDMAANESAEESFSNSVAGRNFVIDKTIAKPTVGGVADGKAYKEDVIPTISFADVNYDSYEVKLVRTRMGEKNIDVTADFISGITEQNQGGSGSYDTFEKIVENDGIYTLTVKMIDKAGNAEEEVVTFTVNRYGSVYEYSDYLVSLIKDGGQYITIDGNNTAAITEDLVITEYNADKLIAGSLKILITRDGEAINPAYTANPTDIDNQEIGESGWYQYVYTIDASNFAEDGVYKITLASEYATIDSDKNESTSVPDNSIDSEGNQILDTMNFVVDTNAPEIRNIVNLEEAIVNAQMVDVKYTIVDIGGLKSVAILLNGVAIDTITEFGDSTYNYSGQFTINESTEAQKIQIIVTDLAGNVTDTASDDFSTGELYVFNDVVTVSTNFLVRWYANKPLFWGSIGGVAVIASAVAVIIAAKSKKKEEE